jgi:hypothetical protein
MTASFDCFRYRAEDLPRGRWLAGCRLNLREEDLEVPAGLVLARLRRRTGGGLLLEAVIDIAGFHTYACGLNCVNCPWSFVRSSDGAR